MDSVRRYVPDNSPKTEIAQQRSERCRDEVRRCLLEIHFLRFSIARQRAQQKAAGKTDSQVAAARARKTLQWLETTLVAWKAKQSDAPNAVSRFEVIPNEIEDAGRDEI